MPELDTIQTSLEFYGGVNSIGGNKILLTAANGKAILLDFGWNYQIDQKYLNDFMKLRKYRILLDSINIGELPIPKDSLAGLYREDLYTYYFEELANRFGAKLGEPTKVSAVLISHAHGDHIGNIYLLHPNITLICLKNTKIVLDHLNAMQKPGSNFTDILKYKPIFQQNYHQTTDSRCAITRVGSRNQTEVLRNIKLLTTGQPLKWTEDGFEIKMFEVDHSIPGASACLIRDLISGKKIVYTGDLRLHGPLRSATENFIKEGRAFTPDVLIIEGTRLQRDPDIIDFGSENAVEIKITEIFSNIQRNDPSKLILFDCSLRDVWRLRSIFNAIQLTNNSAPNSERTMVVNAKIYDLLKRCVENNILTGLDLFKIKIFLPKRIKGIYDPKDYSHAQDLRPILQGSPKVSVTDEENNSTFDVDISYTITAEEIAKNPGKFVIFLPFYQLINTFDLMPPQGSYYLLSKSEPFDDEGMIEEDKFNNWLQLIGIPPDHLYQVHCSGHLSKEDLIEVITQIHPKKLFPVHTEHHDLFKTLGLPNDIEIILPETKKTYYL